MIMKVASFNTVRKIIGYLMYSLLLGFMTLFSCNMAALALTIEEQNQQAIQDMLRVRKELQKISQKQNPSDLSKTDIRSKHGIDEPERKKAPKSSWLESEKDFFRNILQNSNYDVLIVPFQTDKNGIDRTGRFLMGWLLAMEIEKTTGLSVAPVNLVSLALGSHSRYIADREVYNFARQLKVKRIIWGYAGYNQKKPNTPRYLSFTIVTQKEKPFYTTASSQSKRWDNLKMDGSILPSELFAAKLPEVMHFLNIQANRLIEVSPLLRCPNMAVPATPLKLIEDKSSNPIQHAYYLQLLGSLVPRQSEFQRSYLFIRSLMALNHVNPASPDYRLLVSRALYHLDRRPAALRILDVPRDAAEKALQELLNGNFPDMQHEVDQIEKGIKKILAEIELAELQNTYLGNYQNLDIDNLTQSYPGWEFFLTTRLKGLDLWETQSNLSLKSVLDKDFPIPGNTLEGWLKGTMAANGLQDRKIDGELLFVEHIQQILEKERTHITTLGEKSAPNRFDYLVLLKGIGEANLINRVQFITDIQCRPDAGLAYLESILEIFQGHPYFTQLQAEALYELMQDQHGIKYDNMARRVYNNSLNALWWSGSQNYASARATATLNNLLNKQSLIKKKIVIRSQAIHVRNIISRDYPFSVHYHLAGVNVRLLPWLDTQLWIFADAVEAFMKSGKTKKAE